MENWQANQQPDPNICPQKFCFFWNEKGTWIAKGFHSSLESALGNMVKVHKSECGFQYGHCIRNGENIEGKDYYEPCEPALRKAGLPEFYFDDPKKYKKSEDLKIYNEHFGIK